MRLSLFPERIIFEEWTNVDQKSITYDEFFQSCVDACQDKKIDLRSNWSRFYDACKSRKIFWTKEPTIFVTPKQTDFKTRELPTSTEDDFWRVELGYLDNPASAELLNFHNPYAHVMDLATTRYPELYCYYLALFKNHTCRNTYNKMLQKWLLS